ncbi:MAG: hypothetical protein HWE39_05265 [Oceanospirillaceae bacterium]|nr:hypothetical protein [Oceanospirillaceae bacterium]
MLAGKEVAEAACLNAQEGVSLFKSLGTSAQDSAARLQEAGKRFGKALGGIKSPGDLLTAQADYVQACSQVAQDSLLGMTQLTHKSVSGCIGTLSSLLASETIQVPSYLSTVSSESGAAVAEPEVEAKAEAKVEAKAEATKAPAKKAAATKTRRKSTKATTEKTKAANAKPKTAVAESTPAAEPKSAAGDKAMEAAVQAPVAEPAAEAIPTLTAVTESAPVEAPAQDVMPQPDMNAAPVEPVFEPTQPAPETNAAPMEPVFEPTQPAPDVYVAPMEPVDVNGNTFQQPAPENVDPFKTGS